MTTKLKSTHSGSSFDDFLEEEGLREEVEAIAVKRVLAWQLSEAMKMQQKTKQAMARELRTSRSQLDRLLDPENTTVSLETITRAATALGKRVVFEIKDVHSGGHRKILARRKSATHTVAPVAALKRGASKQRNKSRQSAS
jgi:hypothetical protein